MSQRELARRAGVPQPSISRIERGVVSPSFDTLERLVRACGMEIEAIERPGRGVDVTLIDQMLAMSPADRGRYAADATREMQRILERKSPA